MSWFLKSAAITLLTLAPPPRVNAFLRAAPAAVSRRPSRREAESSSDTSGAAASRVVILGGGFGGLYTALRLAEFSKEQPVEITLVDSKDKFVFLPLLYELTTGQAPLDEVAPTFDSLLANTNVKFMQGEVDGIDVGGNVVSVGGVDVPFDRCVVALGGEPLKDTVPGAAENALAFYTLEDAYQLQRELARLDTAPGDVRVVVRPVARTPPSMLGRHLRLANDTTIPRPPSGRGRKLFGSGARHLHRLAPRLPGPSDARGTRRRGPRPVASAQRGIRKGRARLGQGRLQMRNVGPARGCGRDCGLPE
mmetsp:Transcript_46529/g.129689  ORF Transcript_46529/g.129689 Transcript_46529/m.129689 type:complete len:307 (-) Transcript_46529:799-1719(-)